MLAGGHLVMAGLNLKAHLLQGHGYFTPGAFTVIQRAQIDRTSGHQLFNGTRRPSRDKVLQLAISLGLSLEETQQLLQAAGRSPLYPRLKRDAVILYGIGKKLPILTVQENLTKYGLTLLGGLKNGSD